MNGHMLPSGVPRHATPRAFAASTGDAIHVGRGVLTWRLDGLEGVTVWGRVSRVVAEAALAPLTQHAHARIPTPAAAVTDLSRVTEVEPDAYALLHDRLLRLFADVAPKLHEHVIVTPRGLLGAATVGLASATARHRWRVVPDLPAQAALDEDAARAVDELMTALDFATPTAALGATDNDPILDARLDSLYPRGLGVRDAAVARDVDASDHFPVRVDLAPP